MLRSRVRTKAARRTKQAARGRTKTQPAKREPRKGSPRHRNEMEVEDSPVKDDDYSEVDSGDDYGDDFGEAEAPPDPIATPVAALPCTPPSGGGA